MLKKAGIVVAVATAGLLALSPLAFAGDKGGDNGHGSSSKSIATNGDSSSGLVNVADNNLNVPIQACNNDVPVLANSGALTAALGILGKATASSEQSRYCGDNSGSAGNTNTQDLG